MKNFCFAVLLFFVLALVQSAIAGPLTNSAEWRAFHWLNSAPVIVKITIQRPISTGYANVNEIMRRLQINGMDRVDADKLLFSALNEHYQCPYLDYWQAVADIFPRNIEITLMREFTEQFPYSGYVTAMLQASGLLPNEAQSLFYNAIDEHLGCLLEP